MAYALATSYAGEALLSGFNWFDAPDPSHGFVSYQSRPNAEARGLYSVDESTGVVRLGVDHTNVLPLSGGRPSIRLESKEAYTHGLFVADFLHMPPSQCGLWPAFWSYGPNWPNDGEIDLIEGANDQHRNILSAHTSAGCTLSKNLKSKALTPPRTANCDIGTLNVGCAYDAPANDTTSYGDGFNAAGGGVYAMEWDSEYIKIWHFARSQIPRDIKTKKPDPKTWGLPDAVFGGDSCDVDKYFKDMSLVININFCGDWGNAVWGKTDGCGKYASTCSEFVAKNPSAFSNAYWDIRYIDAYENKTPRPSSTVSSSASTSSQKSKSKLTSTKSLTTTITSTVTIHGHVKTTVIEYDGKFAPTMSASSDVPSPSIDLPSEIKDPKDPLQIDGASLLGCFGSSDGFEGFRMVSDSRDMTVKQCVKLCNGTMYAGTYHTQCFCADSLSANTRAVDEEFGTCDHPCPGDKDQFCGGLAKKVGDLANTTATTTETTTNLSNGSAILTTSLYTPTVQLAYITPSLANTTASLTSTTFKPSNATTSPRSSRSSYFAVEVVASPATAPWFGFKRPIPTGTGGSGKNSTQKRMFHWKRKTPLSRRDTRHKNMLLTVYGIVKNKTNQPPPPPMAKGQNITYVFTRVLTSTLLDQQEPITMTVVPVPVPLPTSGEDKSVEARPVDSGGFPVGGVTVVADKTSAPQQTQESVQTIEIVVEECGCETGAGGIGSLETIRVASGSPTGANAEPPVQAVPAALSTAPAVGEDAQRVPAGFATQPVRYEYDDTRPTPAPGENAPSVPRPSALDPALDPAPDQNVPFVPRPSALYPAPDQQAPSVSRPSTPEPAPDQHAPYVPRPSALDHDNDQEPPSVPLPFPLPPPGTDTLPTPLVPVVTAGVGRVRTSITLGLFVLLLRTLML
ncbi:hypothetical protein E4U17_005735 [Claviceps sp. LM77 group G4]|nr:hypothetical protein E4U17_005735 [Claviceps sp. LM77 group G4]KAG6076930.1 hypothetical protein E4U16_002510 [Claviceps sp. LM84 group G4]KAG6082987.1 hypothetical protein E4U33_005142 [Claviceps sp. LM78 group G4]